jgi:hypothetical protein
MRSILSLLFIITAVIPSSAQIASQNDGAWNDINTWSCNCIPSSSDGTITIQNNITIPSGFSVTIDEVTIVAAGKLTVLNGGAVVVANVNNALVVDGILQANEGSSITGTTGTNVTFNSNGRYIHNFSIAQGVIPRASWNVNAYLEIKGYTTFTTATIAGNWNQSFGNVEWNCGSQSTIISLSGLFTTAQSNLKILSTGSGTLRFATTQRPTITIGNDLEIQGNSQVEMASTAAGLIINIGRDFNFHPAAFYNSKLTITGTTTLNITRDALFNANNSTLYFAKSVASGTGTINIKGNFQLLNGTLKEGVDDAAASNGNINFITSGLGKKHTFYNADTIANRINYRIATATDSLQVLGESQLIGHTSSTFTLGGGVLILESTSVGGAIQTGSGIGEGNIRTATRTISLASTVIYAGSGPQVIGNGQVSTTVVINNNSGVTLNHPTATTVSLQNLYLRAGDLSVSNNNLSINGATAVVQIEAGNLNVNSNLGARTVTVRNLVLNGGNLTMSGTANSIGLTVNGATTINSGTLTVSNNAALGTFNTTGDFTLNGGSIVLNCGSVNLTTTIRGDINGTSDVFTFTGANNNLNILGSGALSIPFPFNGNTTLENLTITRPSSIITINDPLTVTNNLRLNSGSVDMENSLKVSGDLNIAKGYKLFFENQTVELQNQYNNSLFGGLLSANSNSILMLTGTGALDTLSFSPTGNTLKKLTLNRVSTGTLVRINSPLTITDSLSLLDGTFDHTSGLTLSSGAVLLRNSNATFTSTTNAAPSGTYSLAYTGTSLTPGREAAGSLNNVNVNVSGTVTLTSSLVAAGTLQISSGTLTSGANGIFVTSLQNSGTINAPTTTLSLSGNLINDGVFNANNGTVAFTGNSAIIGSVNPSFSNISISGTLAAPPSLLVAGTLTINGTFLAGTGSVVFNGAGVQSISGSTTATFNNITLTKASGSVQVLSAASLKGILDLGNNGQFDADGPSNNGIFTILSTSNVAGSDGSVAALQGTADISGKVTVQRYYSIKDDKDRFISSPVTGAPVSDLQDDVYVTGPFTGTSYPCTGCVNNGSNLNWYNELTPGAFKEGYTAIPVHGGANTETLVPGVGYALYMWNGTAATLLDFTGPINKGTIPFTGVTYFNSGTADADGWNLIGNPYPSSIKWDATSWARINISSTVWVWDVVAQVWRSYNYANGLGNLSGGVIATGQGFWIQATASNPSISVTEAAKTAPGGAYYREQTPAIDALIIVLSNVYATDNAYLVLNEKGSANIDRGLDVYKLQLGIENMSVSLLSGDHKLHEYATNSNDLTNDIPLSITGVEGDYELSFSGKGKNFYEGLYLVDLYKGISSPVTENYKLTITSDHASTQRRFYLSYHPEKLLTSDEKDIVDYFPNPVKSVLTLHVRSNNVRDIYLLNSVGRQVHNVKVLPNDNYKKVEIDVNDLPEGFYLLKMVELNGREFIYKIFKN